MSWWGWEEDLRETSGEEEEEVVGGDGKVEGWVKRLAYILFSLRITNKQKNSIKPGSRVPETKEKNPDSFSSVCFPLENDTEGLASLLSSCRGTILIEVSQDGEWRSNTSWTRTSSLVFDLEGRSFLRCLQIMLRKERGFKLTQSLDQIRSCQRSSCMQIVSASRNHL